MLFMTTFVVIIILTIVINRIYHKIFDVTYFSLGAVVKEWATCFAIAFFICMIVIQI